MEEQTILLVDDDPSILRMLSTRLNRDGYKVISAHDGTDALKKAKITLPQLAVIDLIMPGMSGFEVCRRLQEYVDLPVIMLTGVREEDTVVEGLELYAEDYITKPFNYKELLARIRRVLQRADNRINNAENEVVIDSYLRINFARHEVKVGDKMSKLTPLESKLLFYLMKNRGRVITYDTLLQRAWGYQEEGELESLRVRIRKLRQKIEEDPDQPRYIFTERGIGYQFVVAPPTSSETRLSAAAE